MPELTSPHPIGEHAPQQSDLPAPPRAHALTLENRARLTVTGVTRIVSCDELGATLQTPLGDLTIGGQGMQVSELSVRTGEVHISGQIEYLQYTENQQSKKTERWAAGPPAALMVPSPPLWAVLGDVLLCLGAGLLLGAVRDGATLAFGSGPVRCFVWDVLAFAAAAFVCCGFAAGASATGAARWYMAAHGAGGTVLAVVRFPRGAQGAARHGVCSGLAAALLRRTMRYTRSNSGCWPGSERFGTPGGTTHKIHARKAEKSRKMCCKTSAQYYIIKLYLSMPA